MAIFCGTAAVIGDVALTAGDAVGDTLLTAGDAVGDTLLTTGEDVGDTLLTAGEDAGEAVLKDTVEETKNGISDILDSTDGKKSQDFKHEIDKEHDFIDNLKNSKNSTDFNNNDHKQRYTKSVKILIDQFPGLKNMDENVRHTLIKLAFTKARGEEIVSGIIPKENNELFDKMVSFIKKGMAHHYAAFQAHCEIHNSCGDGKISEHHEKFKIDKDDLKELKNKYKTKIQNNISNTSKYGKKPKMSDGEPNIKMSKIFEMLDEISGTVAKLGGGKYKRTRKKKKKLNNKKTVNKRRNTINKRKKKVNRKKTKRINSKKFIKKNKR